MPDYHPVSAFPAFLPKPHLNASSFMAGDAATKTGLKKTVMQRGRRASPDSGEKENAREG